ncbi:MAG: dehydratase [Deltaproteobacteria bacterium]|nr:dehydratase [Deltaproteobacteria bacterium]
MPLNRALVGKSYAPQDYGVTAEAILNYAHAYNEDNPWFLAVERPGGIIAPPMFGVVAGWLSIVNVVTDSDLNVDVLRLLHSEQDMQFVRPMIPGDIITSTATVAAIEEEAAGESLAIDVHCANQRTELVQTIRFTALIRGRGSRDKKRPLATETTSLGEPLFRVRQKIDDDQTYRYAKASGDYNPIHVDENVAKLAGLPGIIVHGLCTMAFASKVMIDRVCGSDPRRLRRLRVRFSRPVLPGQEITTAAWPQPDRDGVKVYAYETYNPDGKDVIRDGIAEVSAG